MTLMSLLGTILQMIRRWSRPQAGRHVNLRHGASIRLGSALHVFIAIAISHFVQVPLFAQGCLNATPSGFAADDGCEQVVLHWQLTPNQYNIYTIQRTGPDGLVTLLSQGLVPDQMWYDHDPSLQYGVAYYYRVARYDPTPGCGLGTFTQWDIAFRIRPSSADPLALRATGQCNGIVVEWNSRSWTHETRSLYRRQADQPTNPWIFVTHNLGPFGWYLDLHSPGNPLGVLEWVYRMEVTGQVCPNDVQADESNSARMTFSPSPVGFAASTIFCDRVLLTWDGAEGDVDGFEVRRGYDSSPRATLPSTAREWTDHDPVPGGDGYRLSTFRNCERGIAVNAWGTRLFDGIIVDPPPEEVSVPTGGTLVLSVFATTTGDPLRYQWWTYCHGDFADDGRVTGSQGPVLTIRNVGPDDFLGNDCGDSAVHVRVISDCDWREFSTQISFVECPSDLNGDLMVNSQDFFDFLTAFFTSAPAADFNHSGAIDSQDFFDFLAAFFAGC